MLRKRGRKSPGDLAAIALNPAPRPPVPAGFDDQEVDCWLEVVDSQPADHLRPEFLPLLEAMVRHVVAGRKISTMIAEVEASMAIAEAEPGSPSRVGIILGATATLNRLLAMRDREVRAASSLATRCRLTPLSTHDRFKPKGRPSGAPVPWEGSPAYRQMMQRRDGEQQPRRRAKPVP